MRWDGELCIVSGSYQAVASTPPRTVVELWCRAREGHSVVLLVDGLSPFLEIAPKGKDGANRDLKDRLDFVQKMDEVVSIGEPVDKWTPYGVKPHYRVEVEQPYVVPRLRKRLQSEWEVSSLSLIHI